MSSQFERVKTWLLNSGIAITDVKNDNCGGVHSFYDEQKQEYAFLYPEITGYYVSTMCFLNHIVENKNYKNMAKKSSDWLIQIFDKYGGIVQGINTDKSRQQFVYSFDTAICAKGLIDYYLISKDEKYLAYGKKLCDWLIEKALEEDGTLKPFKNLKTQKFEESTDAWYKQKGCLHIKTAIPIALMYTITNEPKLLETVNKICDTFQYFQNSDGSLILHRNDKVINLHTVCYALEGLLYGYRISNNEKYLLSCKNAIQWCCNQIDDDGSISLWFNSKYKSKASYPIAQLLRAMILVDKIQNNNTYFPKAEKLSTYLNSFQASSDNPNIDGGFYEECYKTMFGWKKRLKINSWASMFALQALYWFDNYEKLDFNHELEYLY